MMKNTLEEQIVATTRARMHNGQCGYGAYLPLRELPTHVSAAISEGIAEHWYDMDDDDHGIVVVGGQGWEYCRGDSEGMDA